jgi:hypothetical protein
MERLLCDDRPKVLLSSLDDRPSAPHLEKIEIFQKLAAISNFKLVLSETYDLQSQQWGRAMPSSQTRLRGGEYGNETNAPAPLPRRRRSRLGAALSPHAAGRETSTLEEFCAFATTVLSPGDAIDPDPNAADAAAAAGTTTSSRSDSNVDAGSACNRTVAAAAAAAAGGGCDSAQPSLGDELRAAFLDAAGGAEGRLNFSQCAACIARVATRRGIRQIRPARWGPALRPIPVWKV